MEIALADEQAYALVETLTMDQAEGRAWSQKLDAFGSLVKLTSFLQRPQDADFELLYKEHRYQPFWHVECTADYVYERSREYQVPVSGPDARTVTINGVDYPVTAGKIALSALEHCEEHLHINTLIDGYSGEEQPDLIRYTEQPATRIEPDRLDAFRPEGAVVVPPQARASAVVREVLIGVIRSIKADRILEDRVEVSRIDLFYRPVYAFQYRWISKAKEAIIEFDAVTGKMEAGGKTFQQYVGKVLNSEFLFDVGTETVDLLVPGGGLAIKLAKKGIEAAKKKK